MLPLYFDIQYPIGQSQPSYKTSGQWKSIAVLVGGCKQTLHMLLLGEFGLISLHYFIVFNYFDKTRSLFLQSSTSAEGKSSSLSSCLKPHLYFFVKTRGEPRYYLLVTHALHVNRMLRFLRNLLDGKTPFSFKQSFVDIDSRVTWQWFVCKNSLPCFLFLAKIRVKTLLKQCTHINATLSVCGMSHICTNNHSL